MAKLLPYGVVTFPSQGSTEIIERVKHFNNVVSFDALQLQINLFIVLLNSNVIDNRAAIRSITFQVHNNLAPPETMFYAQLHYILVGDADDSPNL